LFGYIVSPPYNLSKIHKINKQNILQLTVLLNFVNMNELYKYNIPPGKFCCKIGFSLVLIEETFQWTVLLPHVITTLCLLVSFLLIMSITVVNHCHMHIFLWIELLVPISSWKMKYEVFHNSYMSLPLLIYKTTFEKYGVVHYDDENWKLKDQNFWSVLSSILIFMELSDLQKKSFAFCLWNDSIL
jgi:hypothetical protein